MFRDSSSPEPSLINDIRKFLKIILTFRSNLGSSKRGQHGDFTWLWSFLSELWYVLWLSLQIVLTSSLFPTITTTGNSQAHTFGLGAMGLHSYLAQQLISTDHYPWSVEFLKASTSICYWTTGLVESNNICAWTCYLPQLWKIETTRTEATW